MKMPTDEVVKDAATFRSGRLGEPLGVNPEAYDRWLRLVKADAWDECLELLQNNSEISLDDEEHYKQINPYREANDDE